MKIHTQKKAQQILRFYHRNFSVGRPYTVLIDGTFCAAAQEGRIPLKERIPSLLQDDKARIVTTPCIIIEAEKLGQIRSVLRGIWLIVKQFPIVKCGHEGRPVPATECIMSLLEKDNPRKYVLGLQDKELKSRIHRTVPGVPIIRFNMKVPVLERPTNMCENIVKNKYSAVSQHEEVALREMKRKYLGEDESGSTEPKKKKVKKFKRKLHPRKKVSPPQQMQEGTKKGRGRHRKKRENMKKSIQDH